MPSSQKLTEDDLIRAFLSLRSLAKESPEQITIDPPSSRPDLMPELKASGYIENGHWTDTGLKWLFGMTFRPYEDDNE